jgi:hypothetical protein
MPTHVKITIEPGIRELFLKYWQEVKQMTTNLYIGDHVFNLESLVFGYKIYDQAYFDLKLTCMISMSERITSVRCKMFYL